ncbi:hypothetical protein DIJ64_13685 [Mycobacterium leprae]|uniref:Uncharacterized protein n=1 Tax=Mycobacterium leprae TaxID=1769 RepID=A0AAD0P7J3_MYCLR|nr:hypothetical protein [Mycobacterium leprae]AWV48727.1 hypothetical protein DIJ64_13685 [Mycobacterium leprae]OAR20506.1 hypothetical protein A8144_02505 [Mycobacterium leprae 3125609]OAX72035.1 hypothetical protein A3216_02290 [Mycobacterium leprae 7935681]
MIQIYGATPIGDALTQLREVLGYDLRCYSDLTYSAAVVIASSDGLEVEIISAALGNGVEYISLVAGKVRSVSIVNDSNSPRLSGSVYISRHTPVGFGHRRQDLRGDRGVGRR